jgi:hypothetical protein
MQVYGGVRTPYGGAVTKDENIYNKRSYHVISGSSCGCPRTPPTNNYIPSNLVVKSKDLLAYLLTRRCPTRFWPVLEHQNEKNVCG